MAKSVSESRRSHSREALCRTGSPRGFVIEMSACQEGIAVETGAADRVRPEITTGDILAGLFAGAAIPTLGALVLYWPLFHYVILAAAIIAIPVILLLGLPACLYLRSRGQLHFWSVTAVGGGLLSVPFLGLAVYFLIAGHGSLAGAAISSSILLFIPGALGGAFGWWIAMSSRPAITVTKKPRSRPSP
jgi:hypothetical protein